MSFLANRLQVPVIIQPKVRQSFDDLLDYSKFALVLDASQIPDIPTILDAVSDEQEPRVTLAEALRTARASRDNRTKKMLKTYRKWKREAKVARKEMRELYKKIDPFEDAMHKRIEAFETKERERFHKKYKETFDRIAANEKLITKAYGLQRSARNRIAKKYGWTCPSVWRTQRRSRNDDDAEA